MMLQGGRRCVARTGT